MHSFNLERITIQNSWLNLSGNDWKEKINNKLFPTTGKWSHLSCIYSINDEIKDAIKLLDCLLNSRETKNQ
jgi:hypothetical protein